MHQSQPLANSRIAKKNCAALFFRACAQHLLEKKRQTGNQTACCLPSLFVCSVCCVVCLLAWDFTRQHGEGLVGRECWLSLRQVHMSFCQKCYDHTQAYGSRRLSHTSVSIARRSIKQTQVALRTCWRQQLAAGATHKQHAGHLFSRVLFSELIYFYIFFIFSGSFCLSILFKNGYIWFCPSPRGCERGRGALLAACAAVIAVDRPSARVPPPSSSEHGRTRAGVSAVGIAQQ